MTILTAPGWQEPKWEKIESAKIEQYPLPWQLGWEHETECEIRDAGGGLVCVIKTGLHISLLSPSLAAKFIIESVNARTQGT